MRFAPLAFWLAVCASPAGAQEWWPVDSRSKAMGNSGVAIVEGPGASYLNPSNLALGSESPFEFINASFGAGAFAYADVGLEGNTIAIADRIADLYTGLNFLAAQNNLNAAGGADETSIRTAIQILDTIRLLNEEETGMFGSIGGGIDVKMGNFGVFVREIGYVGADPFSNFDFLSGSAFSSLIPPDFYAQFAGASPTTPGGTQLSGLLQAAGLTGDADADGFLDADELAFQAEQALGGAGVADPALQQALVQVATNTETLGTTTNDPLNTLFYNGSGVEFRAMRIRETGVSAGIGLPIPGLPLLSSARVGVSLKEVIAETYVSRVTGRDIKDGTDIAEKMLRDYEENRRRSSHFNIDVGAAFQPLPWVTIGVSGKNLLPMEFDFAQPALAEKYTMQPQWKLGLGVEPLGIVKASLDLDLRQIKMDEIGNLKSQMLAGGVELNLPIRVRAGAFANLGSDDPNPVYTLGLGLNLYVLNLDVNGQMATHRTNIEYDSPYNSSKEVEIPTRMSLSASLGLNLRF